MDSPSPLVRVLLIEDNPGDVELVRMALREAGLLVDLTVIDTGVAAMAFARELDEKNIDPRLDLVLLDFNLPGANGKQVLGRIRKISSLRKVPVIVVSGSDDARNQMESVSLDATAFLSKPDDLPSIRRLGGEVRQIWQALRAPSVIREARELANSGDQAHGNGSREDYTARQGKGGKDTQPQGAAARANDESEVPEVLRTPPRSPAQPGRKKPRPNR